MTHTHDPLHTIANTLAAAEQRLDAVLAEADADLRLTQRLDAPAGVEEAVRPLMDAIRRAADELDLPIQRRSHRWRVGAVLTTTTAELTELEPTRLRHAYGLVEHPVGWARLHGEITDAAEEALARLDALRENAA